ncbi:MAG: ROK family protein [Proteobacteria bacterium]|nr:ROK family protein [Pseudomonadota bacterium]
MHSSKIFAGIDIGGTFTKLGIVSRNKVIARKIVKSPTTLIEFFELFNKIKNDYEFTTLGLGIPGIIDHKNMIMKYASPSLGFLNGITIKDKIEGITGTEVYITNDANIVTIGEMIYGAGKGINSAICLTLGTGIGGGLFYKDKLLIGDNGFAAEFGHINVVENGSTCSCGKRKGCVENYFSISGISNLVKEIKGKEYPMEEILKMARNGDNDILQALSNVSFLLGKAIGAILLVIDINTIILAGGLSRFFPYIKNDIIRGIKNYCYTADYANIVIKQSELLENAGILGAAYLAKTKGEILY